MEKNPPKQTRFLVYVSPEEKAQINQLIARSTLNISRFFVSQVLHTPLRRPQRKSLPPAVAETLRTLEKLSGILSLALLKAGDRLRAEPWQQSSLNVRFLSRLISLWVFEDFQLGSFRRGLAEVEDGLQQLRTALQEAIETGRSPTPRELARVTRLWQRCQALRESQEKYYRGEDAPPDWQPVWEFEAENISVHQQIRELIEDYIRQRRP